MTPLILGFLLVPGLMAIAPAALGQQFIRGTVIDSHTNEPLPFVHVVLKNTRKGTSTDLDGNFNLEIPHRPFTLVFSYIGYHKKSITFDNVPDQRFTIPLRKSSYILNEVPVYPGKNPAHRIIDSVLANKDVNDPKSLESYAYDAYNKYYFTADYPDSLRDDPDQLRTYLADNYDPEVDDSMLARARDFGEFIGQQYLFLMESISEVKFRKPGRLKETITATKVSGFKNPRFLSMMGKFQPLDFYSGTIEFRNEHYLNPVTSGYKSNYIFILEDTVFQNSDTVFLISFLPKPGKNFNGLKGQLHIHSDNYAIKNVLASPARSQLIEVSIKQKYEKVRGGFWFPQQIHTQYTFHIAQVGPFPIIGIGRTNIKNVKIDPGLRNREFSHVGIDVEPMAHKRPDTFWTGFRIDSSRTMESNTHVFWDSISKAHNLDNKLRLAEILLLGKIPLGYFNIPINRLIDGNNYEGLRLGMGIETSDRFSRTLTFGGYAAYGIKDRLFKYGGHVSALLYSPIDARLHLRYRRDVAESAGSGLESDDTNPFSTTTYREYLVEKMFIHEDPEVALSFRSLKYLETRLYARRSKVWVNNHDFSWNYISHDGRVFPGTPAFGFHEYGIQFRYALGEKFLRYMNRQIPIEEPETVFHLKVSHYEQWQGEGFKTGFQKAIFLVKKNIYIRKMGTTSLELRGGNVFGRAPAFQLFNGQGNDIGKILTLETENGFPTMAVNEFLNDRFIFLSFRHDFGSHLFRMKNFEPTISIIHQMGVGTLGADHALKYPSMQSMEKGYYESGLLIDRILAGLGAGVYYRYGPYHLPDTWENFSLTLSFRYYLENLLN